MRATLLAAGLIVAIVATGARPLDAAEFAGPTSSIELPALRPDEMAKSVVVAKGVGSDAAALTVELLNPDAPSKGAVEKYEVVADPTTNSWRVEALLKSKTRKPMGKLSVEGDALTFKWEPGVTKLDGGALRNCVVTVGGTSDQAVALRTPLVQKSIPLDLTKDVVRLPLADDLPDETYLTLVVSGMSGVPVSGTISAPEAKVKESVLVGIKPADESSPGAVWRIVLWKSPTQRPEVVLRPELVSALTAPPAGPEGSTAPPADPAPIAGGGTEVVDPTKPSTDILLFTNRSLATAKSNLARLLQQAKGQIVTNQNLIVARQVQLNKFGETDDPVELNAIAQLQGEISALNQQAAALQNSTVPNLEKQLATIDPLEKLRAALHLKAMIDLRVYFTVAGKPVNVFIASDEPTK